MSAFAHDAAIQVEIVQLAPTQAQLSRMPRRLRMARHHAAAAWQCYRLNRRQHDVWHLLDGSHAYLTRFLPACKTVVTVHDIIPWLQVQGKFNVPAPGRAARWLIQQSLNGLNRVPKVLAVSTCTAQDLRATQLVNSSIEVCLQALEPEFFQAESDSSRSGGREQTAGQPPYLFHIGNNGFYKNRLGVVEVFALVKQRVPARLILAGPPPAASLRRRITELQLDDSITIVIDPSDEELLKLYREAGLLLFPSYYEGFGWPPLEAMASGCPVVSSVAGSLAEVIGDAALGTQPDDLQGLADRCVQILTNPELAADLRQRGWAHARRFSLQRLRDQLAGVYRQIATAGREFRG
jgi:glycosyltransferase involved in cell wall biosynthesis